MRRTHHDLLKGGGTDMLKGYTYRLHPTPAQAEFLVRTIGCARFIYNNGWFLRRLKTLAFFANPNRRSRSRSARCHERRSEARIVKKLSRS
nr:helix-turn-helix domain-containing protein [Exiguobacterium profundum]